MRFIPVCFAGLLLAGCANVGGGTLAGSSARPKTIVVTDFVFSSDVVAVDRGYTARLERKIGSFPTHERKRRTVERVNDEIVASIVATLREAGLDAQPGSEEGLSLGDDAIVVSGRLRAVDLATLAKKKDQIGFGAGRGGVVADMTISKISSFGKKQLMAFHVDGKSGPKAAAGKAAAAYNAAMAAALSDEKAAPEKLSPDVEAQARKMGRAAGEKLVAFAREQGWLTADAAAPADDKPVKLPARRPEKKGETKPAAQHEPDADPDPDPDPDKD